MGSILWLAGLELDHRPNPAWLCCFIVNGATPAKNSALTSAGAELRLANGVVLLGKFDGELASHSSTCFGKSEIDCQAPNRRRTRQAPAGPVRNNNVGIRSWLLLFMGGAFQLAAWPVSLPQTQNG
jgi:hypothetical protein